MDGERPRHERCTRDVKQVRVLEEPNLFFPHPAIKVIVSCPGYLSVDERTLRAISTGLGMRVLDQGGALVAVAGLINALFSRCLGADDEACGPALHHCSGELR
jgi:hypothetical protein